MEAFLEGAVLGFAIAAPIGPTGLLCIQRTLAHGRMFGVATGLGAATADACYGAVAAFGLSIISDVLLAYALPIRLAGAGFIMYLAVRIFVARPVLHAATVASTRSLVHAYVSAVFLTLTNPATVISFLAVFAGLGVMDDGVTDASAMVLGVFIGSGAWWLLLSTATGLARGKLSSDAMQWVNRISGILMALLAIYTVWGIR